MAEQNMESNIPQQTKSARILQQYFYEQLGDRAWDEYSEANRILIKQKLLYAIFGTPSLESNLENLTENSTFGYTTEQLEYVSPLYDKICEFSKYSPNKKSIFMSVIFVCCVPKIPEVKDIKTMDLAEHPDIQVVPVFRIRKCIKLPSRDGKLGCCFFVDHISRIYKDWEDYMENNKLKKGIVIAPEKGRYTGIYMKEHWRVVLDIRKSPASCIGAKIRNVADIASTVVAFGTVGVVATSIFVPIGATLGTATLIATAATGVYGVGTSSHHLYERGTHGETIGVKDSQARGCWINIAANSIGMIAGASSCVMSKVAGRGVVIGKGFQMAHDTACIASLIVSGTGIVNSFAGVIVQYEKTKTLPSTLEIFQLASSVLFFTNSLVSNKMASTIIKESQSSSISSYRDTLSNKQRKMFDKMSGETRRIEGMQKGNAEIIRSTLKIGDNTEFFRDAARINKNLNEVGVRISFKDGNALLNGQHVMNPSEFYALDSVSRTTYLTSLNRVDLSVRNAPTRLASNTANVSPMQTIPIGGVITAVKVSRLIESFPDIAGDDEVLLQYIAKQMTTFANNMVIYNYFVELINWLKSHLDTEIEENLAALGIDGTNYFFRIFQACYEYILKFIGDESGIPDALRIFFPNGHLQEERVFNILKYFKEKITAEYKELSSQERRCKICNGKYFCKDSLF